MGATGEGKSGIVLANADGTGIEPLADVMGSNHPLPQVGERLAWSPDGRRIAFVSATPGPEPDMEADPIVITRYWFRPASSAGGRFSDNRRLHIFVADVATKQVAPAHRRHLLRALDRLVARRQAARLPVEPRARS